MDIILTLKTAMELGLQGPYSSFLGVYLVSSLKFLGL